MQLSWTASTGTIRYAFLQAGQGFVASEVLARLAVTCTRPCGRSFRTAEATRKHPFSDPSHSAVVERFEERLARAQVLAVQEQTGRLDAGTATRLRKEVRRALETQLMRYVARVGDVAAHDHLELVGRFRSPGSHVSNAAFLARAWDMLNLAKANQELLVSHGLGGTQLDDLASAITRFEAATEKANAGRRGHVGARADLASVTGDLVEMVGLLDVLNRTRFGSEPELLASWESARNVVGPFRTKAVVPVPAPSGAEAPPAAPTDGRVGKAA